eukprot:scaffold25302_cov27-Phaeocystis_antarctica.AAC.1
MHLVVRLVHAHHTQDQRHPALADDVRLVRGRGRAARPALADDVRLHLSPNPDPDPTPNPCTWPSLVLETSHKP